VIAVVDDLVGRYLDAVDEALPEFVATLYVVGSLALGAWQPGRSDIDTVIFTSRVPTGEDLAGLRDVHAAMRGTPDLDGVYLAPDHGWPADGRVVPHAVGGEFYIDRPCGELTPVLWLTLARYGIPVRAAASSDLGVQVDLEALRAYNLDNLRAYWQPQATGIRRYAAGVQPTAAVDAEYASWMLLGPARLHYTLANEDVISKSDAGEYVIAHFPDYASLAERAIRWRAGEAVDFTAEDLVAAASLTDLIADDAWDRWGPEA
jgi:hypothetical protein